MKRRQKLEHIIIGTLLDITDHWEDCRNTITEDMFTDATCRRIYGLIRQMKQEGADHTDPYHIYKRFGEEVTDIIPRMCEICNEYSFTYQRCWYNERLFLASFITGEVLPPTDVEFIDYVNQFLKLVYENEKARDENRISAEPAA